MPVGLAEIAYSRILDPFYRINLTSEEYVLLKMLLYCYYPSATNLSKIAKELLQKEYNKVSKLLLKHMQIQHGKDEGTKKYSEAINLIGTLFHFMERHKEIYIFKNMTTTITKKNNGDGSSWNLLMDEIFS
jgi:hypothetical protein